jgi:hypothetical protein
MAWPEGGQATPSVSPDGKRLVFASNRNGKVRGETNIFIFTSDPSATFHRVRPVLERTRHLQAVKAAYREVDGEHLVRIEAGVDVAQRPETAHEQRCSDHDSIEGEF